MTAVFYGPLPQIVEEDAADGHQDDEGDDPEPVQKGEMTHISPLTGGTGARPGSVKNDRRGLI
jgi:hypothetical protein